MLLGLACSSILLALCWPVGCLWLVLILFRVYWLITLCLLIANFLRISRVFHDYFFICFWMACDKCMWLRLYIMFSCNMLRIVVRFTIVSQLSRLCIACCYVLCVSLIIVIARRAWLVVYDSSSVCCWFLLRVICYWFITRLIVPYCVQCLFVRSGCSFISMCHLSLVAVVLLRLDDTC